MLFGWLETWNHFWVSTLFPFSSLGFHLLHGPLFWRKSRIWIRVGNLYHFHILFLLECLWKYTKFSTSIQKLDLPKNSGYVKKMKNKPKERKRKPRKNSRMILPPETTKEEKSERLFGVGVVRNKSVIPYLFIQSMAISNPYLFRILMVTFLFSRLTQDFFPFEICVFFCFLLLS